MNYLDDDKSGDIDYMEFTKKISFYDLSNKANSHTLSKMGFIEAMMSEWVILRTK